MVEVNARNNAELGVVERGSAEHTVVGANIGSSPIAGEVIGVRIDGVLQCLKANVGLPEPLVGEGYDKVKFIFEIVGKVAIFRWHGQELPPSYEGNFGIS